MRNSGFIPGDLANRFLSIRTPPSREAFLADFSKKVGWSTEGAPDFVPEANKWVVVTTDD
jgi:hypothetical protein